MVYGSDGLGSQDNILNAAIHVAKIGCDELDAILTDVQPDAKINEEPGGLTVAGSYGYDKAAGEISVSTASGAMVVDDLMQKISTKVQSAAQMLSAANNINKTASRILSQG
jgi:predicted signal transduction protein with EAL and GGDEF domain